MPEFSLSSFNIARLPRIVFGNGVLKTLADEVSGIGTSTLIVTGDRSFRQTEHWTLLTEALKAKELTWRDVRVTGEPSPEFVDEVVKSHKSQAFDCVVGIGGGSAIDTAKAVAGLLVPGNSVMDHLEGVGPELPYRGPSVPLIAVPTTAGAGSEATKNAVLSRHGEEGFKKSFRDEALVARLALVDPDLLQTCPSAAIAANGMDAFTQLLESYVSTGTNPMMESLAWSGMEAFMSGFFGAWEQAGEMNEEVMKDRAAISYAALVSGIVLAQTGLGSVHGLASPLGAFFPAPHGAVCGTLLAEATDVNIRALQEREPDSPALKKYARVAGFLNGCEYDDTSEACAGLVSVLRKWTEKLDLPHLGSYGMMASHISKVVANSRGSSMKTNPINLTDHEIAEIVSRRL